MTKAKNEKNEIIMSDDKPQLEIIHLSNSNNNENDKLWMDGVKTCSWPSVWLPADLYVSLLLIIIIKIIN